MGFYVPTNRDVKFPKACEQCHFYDGLLCCVMDTYVHDPENKHEECPLIEIPENHGRLIDADALREDWLENGENEHVYDTNAMLDSIDNSPTIVPAEGGTDNG